MENPLLSGYREILGVQSNSSIDEIKKAYRKMAKLYHPDINPDPQAPMHFQKLTKAYETLTSPRKIEASKASFLHEKLYNKKIGHLKINFGSFFGFRIFTNEDTPAMGLQQISGRISKNPSSDKVHIIEHSRSITDSVACDHFELVYAGRFSQQDSKTIKKSIKGSYLQRLPWVLLNNRGILLFLEENYEESLKTYDKLNQRIPGNIIFLYRLGLCHVAMAFKKSKRNLFGKTKPNQRRLKAGIAYLEKAIATGHQRSTGRQRCLTIQKILADIYQAAGQHKKCLQQWKKILSLEPKCREAEQKISQADKKQLT